MKVKKAIFDSPRESVNVTQDGQTQYIQIAVNEEKVVLTSGAENEEQREAHEYDFRELIVPIGELDIDDVKENPSTYLEYESPEEETQPTLSERIERLEADNAYLLMINGEVQNDSDI